MQCYVSPPVTVNQETTAKLQPKTKTKPYDFCLTIGAPFIRGVIWVLGVTVFFLINLDVESAGVCFYTCKLSDMRVNGVNKLLTKRRVCLTRRVFSCRRYIRYIWRFVCLEVSRCGLILVDGM